MEVISLFDWSALTSRDGMAGVAIMTLILAFRALEKLGTKSKYGTSKKRRSTPKSQQSAINKGHYPPGKNCIFPVKYSLSNMLTCSGVTIA